MIHMKMVYLLAGALLIVSIVGLYVDKREKNKHKLGVIVAILCLIISVILQWTMKQPY